jgi:hypothetical protein
MSRLSLRRRRHEDRSIDFRGWRARGRDLLGQRFGSHWLAVGTNAFSNLDIRRTASLAHDALTAAASLADMVTDVLVLREFYANGLTGFFAASTTILALAQCSFAFLFTAEYTHGRTPLMKVLVFLCVLPFAQLVPIVTYVTATFSVRRWDRCLKRYGLEREQISRPINPTRYELVEAKVFAHRGFILEAFSEAIPQCALQVVAAMSDGMSVTGAVSILLSIAVVASKSWAGEIELHPLLHWLDAQL